MSNECVEALADFDIHPRSMALRIKKLICYPREFDLNKKDDEEAFQGRMRQQVKRRKEGKESQLGVESMSFLRATVPRCPMALTLSDESNP